MQNEKNGTQQKTLVPRAGVAGWAVRVRGSQRSDVYPADRADLRHRQTVHRARVLDGLRHFAGQVCVPYQP